MVASAAGNVRILSSGETSNIYSFDRVTVDETGRARIHFSDFLVIDVYRDEVGLAWNATVDPSAPPQFKMMLQGGSIFSNLTLNDIASARIKILRMNDTDWIIILAAGC
jgi:hypothetical protein